MIRTYLHFHCCHRENPFWKKLAQSSTVLYGKKNTCLCGTHARITHDFFYVMERVAKGKWFGNHVLFPQPGHVTWIDFSTSGPSSFLGDKCLHPAGAPTMLMITEVGNSMVTITWTTGEERMSPHQLGSDFVFFDLQMFLQISAIIMVQWKKYPNLNSSFCWEPFFHFHDCGRVTGFYNDSIPAEFP